MVANLKDGSEKGKRDKEGILPWKGEGYRALNPGSTMKHMRQIEEMESPCFWERTFPVNGALIITT